MDYRQYLFVGIGAVMLLAAAVTGMLLYGNRKAGKGSTAPVVQSATRLTKSDEIGEDEQILIQHNGEVYSMGGNKIVPAY